MIEILYKDLSYQIVGALFDTHNQLGPGHKELYYQRALSKALKLRGLEVQEQVVKRIMYEDEIIGSYVADFIINNAVVLEIKRNKRLTSADFNQARSYLDAFNLKLAILATFSYRGVLFRRILNIR